MPEHALAQTARMASRLAPLTALMLLGLSAGPATSTTPTPGTAVSVAALEAATSSSSIGMHHCVRSGSGNLCAGGDPRNPNHAGEGRIFGPNRYATAVAVAQRGYPEEAPVVYLANGDVPFDALAGGFSVSDGPVLLVPTGDTVPDVVLDELERLQPDSVIAIGGEVSVSRWQLHSAGVAAGLGQ